MSILDRTDRSFLGVWWWTIDHKLLGMLFLLVIGGVMLLMSAGPPVVEKLNLNTNANLSQHYFLFKQLFFLSIAIPLMLIFSMLDLKQIRRVSILGLMFCITGIILANNFGQDIKGATRWINIAGFTVQPSEFSKPFFAIVNAWLISLWIEDKNFPGWLYSCILFVILISLLLLQPDVGMAFIISSTWVFQFFISGIPIIILVLISLSFMLISIVCFLSFPHVQNRIEIFLEGGGYQIKNSIEAFKSGGFFGQGFGEKVVSNHLPDSHSDFIFAVAGEELGILGAGIIISAYALIFWRGLILSSTTNRLFILLVSSSLIFQFCIQSAIHMASTLSMIPTKGMTLPFISYGGSSLLSSSIGMGIFLAITRRQTFWRNE